MIITFSGMDGAGKSTQIDLLVKKLEKDNKKASYIWARGGYTPGFEFLKKIMRKLLGKAVPKAGHSQARQKTISKPFVSWVWLNIAMLDMAILYGVVLRIKSSFGKVTICDRYIDDTALDFTLNFPHIDFKNMLAWKFLSLLAPVPDKSFLFLIPVEISMQRSLLKDEPFPDSKETLENRLKSYSDYSFFNENKYIRIDGTQTIEKVESKINNYLGLDK